MRDGGQEWTSVDAGDAWSAIGRTLEKGVGVCLQLQRFTLARILWYANCPPISNGNPGRTMHTGMVPCACECPTHL